MDDGRSYKMVARILMAWHDMIGCDGMGGIG